MFFGDFNSIILYCYSESGGPIWSLSFADNTLVSGSYDHTIKVWNIKRNLCLSTLRGHTEWVSSVQLDEGHILSSSWYSNVVAIVFIELILVIYIHVIISGIPLFASGL